MPVAKMTLKQSLMVVLLRKHGPMFTAELQDRFEATLNKRPSARAIGAIARGLKGDVIDVSVQNGKNFYELIES